MMTPGQLSVFMAMDEVMKLCAGLPHTTASTLGDVLQFAPPDSPVHALAVRYWRCDACGASGPLRHLVWAWNGELFEPICEECETGSHLRMLDEGVA